MRAVDERHPDLIEEPVVTVPLPVRLLPLVKLTASDMKRLKFTPPEESPDSD